MRARLFLTVWVICWVITLFGLAFEAGFSFAQTPVPGDRQNSIAGELTSDQEYRIIDKIFERMEEKYSFDAAINNYALEYFKQNNSFGPEIERQIVEILTGKKVLGLLGLLILFGISIIVSFKDVLITKAFKNQFEKFLKEKEAELEKKKTELERKIGDFVHKGEVDLADQIEGARADLKKQLDRRKAEWEMMRQQDSLYFEIENITNKYSKTLYDRAEDAHQEIVRKILDDIKALKEKCKKEYEIDLNNACYYLKEGDAHYYIGDYKNAINAYEKVDGKDHPSVWRRLGNVYTSKGDYSKAYGFYKDVTTASNADTDEKLWAFHSWGDAFAQEAKMNDPTKYSSKDKYTQAIERYNKATEISRGRYPEPRFEKANAHASLCEYDEAIDDYDKVLKFIPYHKSSMVYYSKGLSEMKKGSYENAIRSFRSSIECASENYRKKYAYGACGIANIFLERYDRALTDLNEASGYRDDSAIVWTAKAYALGKLRDKGSFEIDCKQYLGKDFDEYKEEAMKKCECEEAKSKNYGDMYDVAKAYALIGEMEKVKSCLNKAIAKNPFCLLWIKNTKSDFPKECREDVRFKEILDTQHVDD